MKYTNIFRTLLFLCFFSMTLLSLSKSKITKNPTTEIKLKGFENQDKQLINDLFYASGWFDSSSWSEKTLNQGVDMSLTITRISINTVKIQPLNVTIDISKLYGKQLATKIVNTIGNKVFSTESFNNLMNSKIIFSAEGDDKQRNIYTIEIDGSNLSQKTYNGNSSNPTWMKSKQYILYDNKTPVNTNLIIKNIETNQHRLFSYFNGINSQAEVSHDDKKVALCLSFSGTIDIGIMDTNSQNFNILLITNNKNLEFSPSWSPNNKNICFSSSNTEDKQISTSKLKIVNIISKEIKELFPSSQQSYYNPNWGLNNLIAYSKQTNDQFVIAYTDPLKDNNETIINIQNIKGDWLSPSWAPDGRHLTCVNKTGNESKLYIIDSWFNTAKEIPLNLINIRAPKWSSSF